MGETATFQSAQDAAARLGAAGYLPSQEISMAAFLADRLEKPILVEGPAGVGKTALATGLARALGRPLIRLQCYEGLDETKALYEWEYGKQLLYSQLLKDKVGELVTGTRTLQEAVERLLAQDSVFFSERFLLPRPVLQAILSPTPALLLVDELDKADPEFEAFLLEVLADNAVTLPELGTLRARHIPRVVLTSNSTRELSDALRRRCLHLFMDFPERARELQILRMRLPGLPEQLAEAVVKAVEALRRMALKKPPSISETLDWAQSLVLLNAETLTPALVADTLNVLLKHTTDLATAKGELSKLTSP